MKYLKDFNLFENINNNILNIPDSKFNEIINKIHYLVYKGTKRGGIKNYKNISIKTIEGYFEKRNIINNKLFIETTFDILMNNNDKIECEYIINDEYKYIEIIINGETVYDMENQNYTYDDFLNMLYELYKLELKKQWKVK